MLHVKALENVTPGDSCFYIESVRPLACNPFDEAFLKEHPELLSA